MKVTATDGGTNSYFGHASGGTTSSTAPSAPYVLHVGCTAESLQGATGSQFTQSPSFNIAPDRKVKSGDASHLQNIYLVHPPTINNVPVRNWCTNEHNTIVDNDASAITWTGNFRGSNSNTWRTGNHVRLTPTGQPKTG
jgi:hypothetical protein